MIIQHLKVMRFDLGKTTLIQSMIVFQIFPNDSKNYEEEKLTIPRFGTTQIGSIASALPLGWRGIHLFYKTTLLTHCLQDAY